MIIIPSDPISNPNDKNINLDEIPKFKDIRSMIKDSLYMYINLKKGNDVKNIKDSTFKVLMFIKQKKYESDYITIFTEHNQYTIYSNQLDKINKISDLNSILNKLN